MPAATLGKQLFINIIITLTMMVIGILYELHNSCTVDGQVVGIGLQIELDHSSVTKVVLDKAK